MLNKKQFKTLKELIFSEKERIHTSLNMDKKALELDDDGNMDEIDKANADYQRAHDLRLKKRDLFYAKKLSRAIEKINTDEYGICEECGANIKFERLLARPTAELCIICKDEAEKEELSNFSGRQSKSLGKHVHLVSGI